MRKFLVGVAALAIVAAACSSSSTTSSSAPASGGSTSAAPVDAKTCAQGADVPYITSGTLTIGTDNPAFQPWFGGTGTYGPWKANPNFGTGNPASGEGYESAVAYAIADQMGFTKDQVTWVPVNFNESFKPGPKSFDFDINEISYKPERAQVVTFSDSYYDVSQALVVKKDGPYANASTFADIQGAKLGAQVGTTSYSYIVDNIKPTQQPQVYDKSVDVITAFNNGQIDGYVTDAPTAYVNVLIGEAKGAVVAGQFPQIGAQEYFGVVLNQGNPLVDCINTAIGTLQGDGTLSSLQQKWLKPVTFPEISQ
jgi:polar amino acid transport system substrate-binding protein